MFFSILNELLDEYVVVAKRIPLFFYSKHWKIILLILPLQQFNPNSLARNFFCISVYEEKFFQLNSDLDDVILNKCIQFFPSFFLQPWQTFVSYQTFLIVLKQSQGLKGTVMQIEKALINDRLRVLKISWKFRIPTIFNFVVIHPWNLQFS